MRHAHIRERLRMSMCRNVSHSIHYIKISRFSASPAREQVRGKRRSTFVHPFFFSRVVFFSLSSLRMCLRGGLVREFLRINSARIKKMRTKRSKITCFVGQTYRRETFSSVASDSSSQSQSLSVFVRPWLLRCIYPKSRTSLFSNLEWNTSARLNR
jgi:hypothetical protein